MGVTVGLLLPPLTLASRLLAAISPPRVLALVELLRDARQLARFRALFHQYLPDLEARAFGGHISARDRLGLFGKAFSERYFPITWSGYAVDYDWILEFIPIEPMGICVEEYFNGAYNGDPSFAALACLMESPYGDMVMDDGEYEEGQPLDPERVTYLARLEESVGRDIAKRVPVNGIPHELLQTRLSDTRYEAALVFYDLLHETSPHIWLCLDQEDYNNGEMELLVENFPWDPDRVATLAREWPQAKLDLDALRSLMQWLEEDMPLHFGQLLDAALGKRRRRQAKLKPLLKVFSHVQEKGDDTDGDGPSHTP